MGVVIEKIVPIILVFVLGYFLKRKKILTRNDGDLLLKLFFYVSIPSLIIVSVSQMNFTMELLLLPVIASFIIVITYVASSFVGRVFDLDRPSFGTFLVGALVMNTGFIFPFMFAVKGEQGLARASLFDFGSVVLVFTFVYYQACKYGNNSNVSTDIIKKLFCSPPLLALVAGLYVCLNHLALPPIAVQFFKILGNMTSPLMMLSLGVYFSPKVLHLRPLLAAILLRMGIGLLLGLLFIRVFGLHGLSRTVVLVCSSAPSGISTLVFSSMEELDKEFASSLVSYSTLVGMVLIPLQFHFFVD